MSTHNLCFRAKIRKNIYPCTPQFYYIKVGCKGYKSHGHVILMTPLMFAKTGFLQIRLICYYNIYYNYEMKQICFNNKRCHKTV